MDLNIILVIILAPVLTYSSSFHFLLHSFISNYPRAGLPMEDVMSVGLLPRPP